MKKGTHIFLRNLVCGVVFAGVSLWEHGLLSEIAYGLSVLVFFIMYCGWKLKRNALFPGESWRSTPFPLPSKEFPELSHWAVRSYVWLAVLILIFWGSCFTVAP